MSLLRAGTFAKTAFASVVILMLLPTIGLGQDSLVFKSDEYGFTMRYPATWVKIDKPQGNYYVVFQAPELTDNFRSRIHVAAHSPVKDSLDVFKQELKQGIADMQKAAGSKDKQTIQILDEGDFKCDVPGAYYFFIQAYEEKLKMWMDIVIVFYKHDDTLLRISCLAPSQSMEKFHALFNDALVSVKFAQTGAPAEAQPPAARPQGTVTPAPPRQAPAPTPQAPPQQVAPQPPAQAPQPPTSAPQVQQQAPMAPPPPPAAAPAQPTQPQQAPTMTQPQPSQQPPAPPGGGPGPGPRGPARTPEKPPTGIVN